MKKIILKKNKKNENNILKKNILINYIMVEQIKLIYKLKGFDTEFFSNNKSEINTAFNFASNFKKILTNYYEKK